MSWPYGSTQVDNGSQNNNIFATKSSPQHKDDGSKGDRFPLYIVNIPVNISEEELKEMFSQAGNVIHSKLLEPKEGRNSRAGFITFASEEEAEKAISMFNETRVNGQTLRVDYTKSFKEQKTRSSGNSGSPFSSSHKNITSPGMMGGFGQRSSPHQSNGPSSIGRGIHYGNEAGSQPAGPAVNGESQGHFNPTPGMPPQTQDNFSSNENNYGQSNYERNFQNSDHVSPHGNFNNEASQSHSINPGQMSNQSDMNTMINGFGSMHVSNPAEQVQMYGQNKQGVSSYDQNQTYEVNQAATENNPYDPSQAYNQNQTYGQTENYDQNQPYSQNQSQDHSQGYAGNVETNESYAQNQTYDQNQAYDQNTAYQNQSYDSNQAYSQHATYGENQGYDQNQWYGQNQSYDQNQTYDSTQQYNQNQGYGENQGYDQNQTYDQNQSYDTSQAYNQISQDQSQVYNDTQYYQQNQSHGEFGQTSSQPQPEYSTGDQTNVMYAHQDISNKQQTYGGFSQSQEKDQSTMPDSSGTQIQPTNQIQSFDEMFGKQSTTNDAQQQLFGQNQFNVSSRLPKSQDESGGKTCHNCGQQGHFSRECPTKKSQGGGCHRCGENGHFARECLNNNSAGGSSGGGTKSSGRGSSGCHKCGEQGHFARECPNNSGSGGTGDIFGSSGSDGCHRCGEQGHFARECPKSDQGSCPRPAMRIDYVPPPIPEDVDMLFKSSVHKGINFDRFDNIPVEVTGNNPPAAIQTFDELLLPDTLKSNLAKAEFTKPTPVQKHGMPIILSGRDVMACAQTGSGKTVAFLLPVMAGMVNNRLAETSYLGGDAPCPAALCISPTRELTSQIFTEALKFSTGTYLRPVVCYGGVSVSHQLSKLERGCHILIATPGRLLDFVGRNKVNLKNVRYLILDEADRMLDMGFENDVRKIVTQFGMPDKTQRQTLMFSATFPDPIQKLAREFLNDYLFLAVGSVGGSNLDIKQEVLDVQGNQKRSVLMEILGQSGTEKTLVFVERKRNADFLANWLSQNKYPATSISGDRSQQEREEALRDFSQGRAPVLIATSVAARGLDIPGVKHVINYDLPQQIEEYVHRIGRTGRIGNQGKATAFFERGKDDKLARSLVKVLSDALQDVPNWLEEVAEHALGSSYGPAGGKFASRDARQFDRRSGGTVAVKDGNSQPRRTTNVSFVNSSHNAQQNGDDEEEWE